MRYKLQDTRDDEDKEGCGASGWRCHGILVGAMGRGLEYFVYQLTLVHASSCPKRKRKLHVLKSFNANMCPML